MANATVSLLGDINQASQPTHDTSLFLKRFSGEVLVAFEQESKMLPRTLVKTIDSGKSAQFPRTGTTTASYHTVGNEITGNVIDHAEIVVTIDDILTANVFIADIDEAMNHYDASAIYARELGVALANTMDEHIMIEHIGGGMLTGVGTELPTSVGGFNGSLTWRTEDELFLTTEVNTGSGNASSLETKVDKWVEVIFKAAARFDTNNIPRDGRYLIVRPREYYDIIRAVQTSGFSVSNADYGSAGSMVTGKFPMFGGFEIIPHNLMPQTDLQNTGAYSKHAYDPQGGDVGNYDQIAGIFGFNGAVGTVKLKDMTVRADYDPRRLGTLTVAKYLVGHRYLRPEGIIVLEISTGDIAQ